MSVVANSAEPRMAVEIKQSCSQYRNRMRLAQVAGHARRHCDFVNLCLNGVHAYYVLVASAKNFGGMADDWRIDCDCVCIGAARGKVCQTP
jgi:hypothetical protein